MIVSRKDQIIWKREKKGNVPYSSSLQELLLGLFKTLSQ